MVDYNNIIISPLLTEKSNLQRDFGKHFFKVGRSASKLEIKKAIEYIFNVSVVSCNIVNVKKRKSVGRFKGSTKSRVVFFKKAIISLKKGDVFNFYGGV